MKRTMIPMPPSQCISIRHQCIERLIAASISVNTVAPVVVKPETDSKIASTGEVKTPSRRKGSEPSKGMHSQVIATTTRASRRWSLCEPPAHPRAAAPRAAQSAEVMAKLRRLPHSP